MVKKGSGRHRPKKYKKHKKTKHRTLQIPEGFEFLKAERHPIDKGRVKVVFKKKKR